MSEIDAEKAIQKRDVQCREDLIADKMCDWLSSVTEDDCNLQILEEILGSDNDSDIVQVEPQQELIKFHRQYQTLIDANAEKKVRENNIIPLHPHKKPRKSGIIRRLLSVAAVVAVLASTIVSAQALGMDVLGGIARWTTELFSLSDDAPPVEMASITKTQEEGQSWTYDSIQEAFDAFGIKAKLVPTWIPERFTESGTHEVYANTYNGVCIGEDYISGDNLFSFALYEKDHVPSLLVEKDGREPDSIFVEGQLFYLFYNGDIMNIVWESGDLTCCIFAKITEDEMLKILQSIYL